MAEPDVLSVTAARILAQNPAPVVRANCCDDLGRRPAGAQTHRSCPMPESPVLFGRVGRRDL